MNIIVNKKENVIKICNEVVETEYLFYCDGTGLVKSNLTKIEVASVDEEVKELKYNYNEEKGFYLNEEYSDPNEIRELKEQLTLMQKALDELALGGM